MTLALKKIGIISFAFLLTGAAIVFAAEKSEKTESAKDKQEKVSTPTSPAVSDAVQLQPPEVFSPFGFSDNVILPHQQLQWHRDMMQRMMENFQCRPIIL